MKDNVDITAEDIEHRLSGIEMTKSKRDLINNFIDYIANYEYDPSILKEPEIPKYYIAKPSVLDRTKKATRIKERVVDIFNNISY